MTRDPRWSSKVICCAITGSLPNSAATVAGPSGSGSGISKTLILPYEPGSLDTTISARSSLRALSAEKGTNGRTIEKVGSPKPSAPWNIV